jgi:putative hydrolase of the HAD superfamily
MDRSVSDFLRDQPLQAILLDAVGTTIYPARDVSQTYSEFGKRYGCELGVEEIRQRFRAAFRAEEAQDKAAGYRTSEERERQRWQTIVGKVFTELKESGPLFEDLWQHFRQPSSWRVYPDTVKLIEGANQKGLKVILASNFDGRLRAIVGGFPELAGLHSLAISSELGWRKPAREFYHQIVKQLKLEPSTALSIGDDRVNDYEGALAAGLQAKLVNQEKENRQDAKDAKNDVA